MAHCHILRPTLYRAPNMAQETHLANKARAKANLILQPPENSLQTDRQTTLGVGVHWGKQQQSNNVQS